jgi:multidrug resistance efflux pump
MVRRSIALIVVICLLVLLIAYSKFRDEPRKVSGFIEADEIRLGSRVGGRVARVLVEEGQQVKTGDVLIEIEPFDLLEREEEARATLAAREAEYARLVAGLREEEVLQAEARHNQANATLDRLKAGPRPQEIEAARGRLDMARAELKLAQEHYKRERGLSGTGASTQEELDTAIQRLDAAEANVLVREQELGLLEEGTREEEIREANARVEEARHEWQLARKGFRQEEVDQARAARDAAQAALNVIAEQKKELLIHSPVDGTVEALELQRGDLVPPNAPVLSVMDTRRMWVRAYLPQNYLNIAVGHKLRVTVDSFPGKDFVGVVTFVSRQAEFTPSNVQTPEERSKQVFRMKVELQDAAGGLRPGMAVDVWLNSQRDTETIRE